MVDRYIGWYLSFFKSRHRQICFSVWPMCSRRDFYFDDILPLVPCHRSVLSNTDRSLFNNQIELLNKGIKIYTNSIITIAFISNKGHLYFLVCRQDISKYALISLWIANEHFISQTRNMSKFRILQLYANEERLLGATANRKEDGWAHVFVLLAVDKHTQRKHSRLGFSIHI